MRSFMIKVLVNGIAIWVAALVVPGIELGQTGGLGHRLIMILLVAVVFGLVNAVIKPVATFFAFPFIILTLGLFALVVNAAMLELTSWFAGGLNLPFEVKSFFWAAVLGSVVISFVSMILNVILPDPEVAKGK